LYYFEILKSLSDNQIRHLLVGGLSVNLHGVPRFTHDLTDVEMLKQVKELSESCNA